MPLDKPRARAREKAWRAENPTKVKAYRRKWNDENAEQKKAIEQAYLDRVVSMEDWPWRHCPRVRGRAKRDGIPFDITWKDIADVMTDTCPVLGIKMQPNKGAKGNRDTSPSVDRIRPELGYIKGNIKVISYRANKLRNDATAEELEAVVAYIRGLKL